MIRIKELHWWSLFWLATLLSAQLALIGAWHEARANDGEVITPFAPQFTRRGQVYQILIQPDGKILVAGWFTTVNGISRSSLVRFNADGTLDVSFNPAAVGSPLFLQPDGKILFPGRSRLNSDGTLDTTFKPGLASFLAVLPDGKIAATNISSFTMTGLSRLAADGAIEIDGSSASRGYGIYINRAASQSDGKVIFAGNFYNYNGVERHSFARLNADWSLDLSFATGEGPDGINSINSIVPLPGGKIYIAGSFTRYDGVARPGLARLNADGSLDASFDPPTPNAYVHSVIPLAGDKLLIAGSFTTIGGVPRSRIARLNADGSLDPAFDPGLAVNDSIDAMAVQSDGKILVGGSFSRIGSSLRFCIARLTPDGALDSTFNASITLPESGSLKFIGRTTEGKFIIFGDFDLVSGIERNGLARLNADGSLDPTFNPNHSITSTLLRFGLQSDGKIVVADATTDNGKVTRLNTDGSVDAAFGVKSFEGATSALLIQPDGRLLIGGSLRADAPVHFRPMLVRLNPDGTPDPTFVFNSQENGTISAMHMMPDGKILVSGSFLSIGGVQRSYLARLNSDGTVDSSFDLTADWNYTPVRFTPYPGGKVLLRGSFTNLGGVARKGLALLNSDGSLDAAFAPIIRMYSRAESVLPDGRVLFASGSTVLRLKTDGSLDFAYSFPVWQARDEMEGIHSLLALPDGRAVAGGTFLQAGAARKKQPLLAMFEAGGPTIPVSAATITSAASYDPTVANGSVISIFGMGFSTGASGATSTPLPTTLNGVRIKFIPNRNLPYQDAPLPLFFVSEKQINCLFYDLFTRDGILLVERENNIVAVANIDAVKTAPGIFTADSSGGGYPAALVLRAGADGARVYEPVVTRNAAGQLVARPIDLGPETDQLFLILYITGARDVGAFETSRGMASIGEVAAQVQYLNRAPGFEGVEQVNLLIPRSLKGINRDVEVKLSVDGIAANPVKIYIK